MKKLFFVYFLCLHGLAIAQVGIGTNSPAASAQLDISSTTKGFLPPRMTTAQRNNISSPVEGLIIFNSTTKLLEVYVSNSGSGESYLSGSESCATNIGSSYMMNQWMNSSGGMAQSFVSGGGSLSSITIKVSSVEPQSTSNIYELNVFNGSPSGCGNNGSTCALSALGTPIATSQVTISSSGEIILYLQSALNLSANQTYTFSITPTVSTQGFMWACYSDGYSNGASFGISGNVSGPSDDFKFKTNYFGWRGLQLY